MTDFYSLCGVQFECLTYLLRGECASDVLLVAKDEQSGTCKFFLRQKLMKFFFTVLKTYFITAIDDPDKAISLFEIVSPIRPDGGLTANIPNVQFKSTMLNRLDLEP